MSARASGSPPTPRGRSGPSGRRRDEAGQVTVMIIGFAAILVLLIAVVVDASAAYLHRQGLDNLADGAALQGADLGSGGIYEHGIGDDRLLQESRAVHDAVADYLQRAGAGTKFPGVRSAVRVDAAAGTVTVVLTAPMDLPLSFPGATPPLVSASSTAAVQVER